ncbi:GNAT family N-acetyltransferase [Arthrobacter sp. RAF14]|uniref:GNAT family N-acetyltransferase n=1 Tax=Arthrobacter sp. RAF14 TaxID=3233051 RepID=UPI003F92AD80
MLTLIRPHADAYDAWKDCLEDFGDGPLDGSGFNQEAAAPDLSREGFDRYLEQRLTEGDTSVEPAPGRVHCSYFWIADPEEDRILGFLAIRHDLNDFLFNYGGHIGYSVRPSARRQGAATTALAHALRLAPGLGIDDVLVTCVEDNAASRAVIEGNDGQYEDSRDGFRRYWFPVG